MIFSLEALQAMQGDSLILYYGDKNNPSIIIIDGGPANVYNQTLKPRLLALKSAISDTDPLNVEMVMISHADDDHIHGIIDLTNELISQQKTGRYLQVNNLWFNSFDDIIGNNEVIEKAQLGAFAVKTDAHVTALIASTDQGRKIRDKAQLLGWTVNSPFKPLQGSNAVLVRGDTPQSKVNFGALKMTVVHPDQTRLTELQKKWDQDLKAAKKNKDNSIVAAALSVADDKSPFNLSSIVCLVEFDYKKILLTGDGRCDDIYTGLEKNALLTDGKLHVDILKMPHHGSFHNMNDDFLKNITANHYVFSANGKYDNPDQETLDMVQRTVTKGTIHFTNYLNTKDVPPLQPKIDKFIAAMKTARPQVNISYRAADKPSLIINLDETLPY